MFADYVDRRKVLVKNIKQAYPEVQNGLIVLFANFEKPAVSFRQESSFYYFTGVNEPGVVAVIDMNADASLFIPHCFQERAKWSEFILQPTQEHADMFHLKDINVLGQICSGYAIGPFFSQKEYVNLLKLLNEHLQRNGSLFVLSPVAAHGYVEQRYLLERIESFLPAMAGKTFDISSTVAQMRRVKHVAEIEKVSEAINITLMGHEAAAQSIKDGALESEVQAAIEYVFTAAGAKRAFPSIVASGNNGTVLHYSSNSGELNEGELVVVDIGAEYNHYCADITRTYPVSGTFSDRQKELYHIVLKTQEHIASLVKPGIWLNNNDVQEHSLHHLAQAFLKESGYDQYFPHGIGHFLGLDVHDVGDLKCPLQDGDLITIEPGIYIPQEGLGIRIEDDFWVTSDKAICLSQMLPKDPEAIEAFMVDPSLSEQMNLIFNDIDNVGDDEASA